MLEKVRLPEIPFFYKIAMKRSAELKQQMQEMAMGANPQNKAGRLTNWGSSLMNKLPAITRRRRKRDADKRRRVAERHELQDRINDVLEK